MRVHICRVTCGYQHRRATVTAVLLSLAIAPGCDEEGSPPPIPFTVTVAPESGPLTTDFVFTVEGLGGGDSDQLEIRWDFNDDGDWDTPWSEMARTTHRFDSAGTRTARAAARLTGGATGEATASATVFTTSGWSNRFATVVDGRINALAVYPEQGENQTLLMGGRFSLGSEPEVMLAAWDGNSWQTLATGSGEVFALEVDGSRVFVGGQFTAIAGIPASNIAEYSAGTFSPKGEGFDDAVYALETMNSKLYAGGRFLHSGATGIEGIASWDGDAWLPLTDISGGYVVGTVRVLRAYLDYSDQVLGVGGDFAIGGDYLENLASWDDREVPYWDSPALYEIPDGEVTCLAISGTSLIVAGAFATYDNGLICNGISEITEDWQIRAPGGGFRVGSTVRAIVVYRNTLVAAGDLGLLGSSSPARVAYLAGGIEWRNLEAGIAGSGAGPLCAAVFRNDLYFGGDFETAGGWPSRDIALWQGPLPSEKGH